MRLLNTGTLTFETFYDEQTPPYSILSHRWTAEEVSYVDFIAGKKRDHAGHKKVLEACRLAKSQSHTWIWIDTVCIDKTSSAELTEAINSMYQYYADAQICFAYLKDVSPGLPTQQTNDALQGSEWSVCRHSKVAPTRVNASTDAFAFAGSDAAGHYKNC